MHPIERIQKKPLTVLTVFGIIVALGGLLMGQIPIELMPDMELGVVVVQAIYPQAGPEEVEEQVTIPLEDALGAIPGLDSMETTSRTNSSTVILWFKSGVDIDSKVNEVETLVKATEAGMPSTVEIAAIRTFDPNALPVLTLSLSGPRSVDELQELAVDLVKPELERVNGVASLSVSGGRERQIQVLINKNRLEAHHLTMQQVSGALAQNNLELSAGSITNGSLDYLISTAGAFASLDDISDAVIAKVPLGAGRTHEVRLRDIATVKQGYAETTSLVRIDREEGVSLSIQVSSDANVVELSRLVHHEVKEIEKKLPKDLALRVRGDNSVQVTMILNSVIESTYVGVILAVLVLAVFLGRWSSTLIVSISIPFSLMITIAAMAMAGKSFNLMSLGGILMGLGMIVDSSIVILENIDTYQRKGVLPKVAALIGTREMVGPIIGSILTSIAVFLPMFLMKEQMGIFGPLFADMSFTVIATLLSSLVVAIILIPVLASLAARGYKKARVHKPSLVDKAIAGLDLWYKKALHPVVHHPVITIMVAFVILLASLFFIPSLGIQFTPQTSPSSVTVDMSLPSGTTLEVSNELMNQLELTVLDSDLPLGTIISTAGMGTSFSGRLEIHFPDGRADSALESRVKATLREVFSLYPQARFEFVNTDRLSAGNGSGTLQVTLEARDLTDLTEAESVLSRYMRDTGGLGEIRSTLSQSLPKYELRIDRARASDLGINAVTMAQEIRAMVAGSTATRMSMGSETLDVVVSLRPEDRQSQESLMTMMLMTNTGKKVPVSSVASLVRTESPVDIKRIDKSRVVTITGTLLDGANASRIQSDIQARIQEPSFLPAGVAASFGGESQLFADALDGMILVALVAVLLVFAVMVSQFESLRAPFIIILAMPTMLTGVILAYWAVGLPLSMPAVIGIIMLAGIVVNNGIILVDYINLLRARGEALHQAAINGGASRLRPVLMTTLTTVLAMIPMAFFPGEGTQMLQPLGLTVVGGLSFNTLVTLFFVPAMYVLTYRRQESKRLKEAHHHKSLLLSEGATHVAH